MHSPLNPHQNHSQVYFNNLNNKTGPDGKFDVDDIADLLGGVAESNKVNKLLNEASKLGHFEPEESNVDIEKLRKGIMQSIQRNHLQRWLMVIIRTLS